MKEKIYFFILCPFIPMFKFGWRSRLFMLPSEIMSFLITISAYSILLIFNISFNLTYFVIAYIILWVLFTGVFGTVVPYNLDYGQIAKQAQILRCNIVKSVAILLTILFLNVFIISIF